MAFRSDSTIERVLRSRTETARENLLRKRAEFDAIVEAIQQGFAGIEGASRIGTLDLKSAARNALERAVSEFNEYLTCGIVPEDIQSGETE